MKKILNYTLSITVGLLASFAFLSFTYASTPQKYDSVSEMIEDIGDYSSSNNTFKVINKSPLHIQLATLCVAGHSHEVKEEYTQMAIIYGLYKAFIHTDIEKLTVTAIAFTYDPSTKKETSLDDHKKTVTLTRTEALEAVDKFKPFSSFNELVSVITAGSLKITTWSANFKPFLCNDMGSPGIDRFYKTLSK